MVTADAHPRQRSQMETAMSSRAIRVYSALLFTCALMATSPVAALAGSDGIVRVKSAYPIAETIERLKRHSG